MRRETPHARVRVRDGVGRTAPRRRAPVIDLSPFGLAIGHATDAAGATGVTVLRGVEAHFRAAVAVTGRATASRELDVLSPRHLVDRVDALVLTGGSAYGLDCAAGVMRWMEERGRGYDVGAGVVPIVPAAALFDLAPLGAFGARPTADMAYAACDAARSAPVEEGSVGAGAGATVGKVLGAERAMKGGFGCWVDASAGASGGARVGAAVAVNALGDVRDGAGRVLAGARDEHGGFADGERVLRERDPALAFASAAAGDGEATAAPGGLRNTTLAVVMTDAVLSRQALAQLAAAAGAAFARRITPSGTSFDGDIIFAVCPVAPAGGPTPPDPAPLHLEARATGALEVAIERAVRAARGRDGVPGLADTSRGTAREGA